MSKEKVFSIEALTEVTDKAVELNEKCAHLTAELAEARAAMRGTTVSCVCGGRDTARLDWLLRSCALLTRENDFMYTRADIDAAMEQK